MRILNALIGLLVIQLALAQVVLGFKIWKKVCKPIAMKEHQLVLFSGVTCQMVLIDPFEPLLKFLNQPIWMAKTTRATSTVSNWRRGGIYSASPTTTSSWSEPEPVTTFTAEPIVSDQSSTETPSMYSAPSDGFESSTPSAASSTQAIMNGLANSSTIVPDLVQPISLNSHDVASNPIVTSDAHVESYNSSSVQPTGSLSTTETTLIADSTQMSVQPEVLHTTTTPDLAENLTPVSRDNESTSGPSQLGGGQSTNDPQVSSTSNYSTAPIGEPAQVQPTTVEPTLASNVAKANLTPIDTEASTQTVAPSNNGATPEGLANQADHYLSSTVSVPPISNSQTQNEIQPKQADPIVSDIATPEVIVAAAPAATQLTSTINVSEPIQSTTLETIQEDSPNTESSAAPFEYTPTERTQTLVVSSATASNPSEPMPEAAPSPAPLRHDPTSSEAPPSLTPLASDLRSREHNNGHFTEAMEPN